MAISWKKEGCNITSLKLKFYEVTLSFLLITNSHVHWRMFIRRVLKHSPSPDEGPALEMYVSCMNWLNMGGLILALHSSP